MHKIMLKIEVQCPKIIAKLYKDMVTPMDHWVNEMCMAIVYVIMSSLQIYDFSNHQIYSIMYHFIIIYYSR